MRRKISEDDLRERVNSGAQMHAKSKPKAPAPPPPDPSEVIASRLEQVVASQQQSHEALVAALSRALEGRDDLVREVSSALERKAQITGFKMTTPEGLIYDVKLEYGD